MIFDLISLTVQARAVLMEVEHDAADGLMLGIGTASSLRIDETETTLRRLIREESAHTPLKARFPAEWIEA